MAAFFCFALVVQFSVVSHQLSVLSSTD